MSEISFIFLIITVLVLALSCSFLLTPFHKILFYLSNDTRCYAHFGVWFIVSMTDVWRCCRVLLVSGVLLVQLALQACLDVLVLKDLQALLERKVDL